MFVGFADIFFLYYLFKLELGLCPPARRTTKIDPECVSKTKELT